MTTGQRIKKARKGAGLTQKELAEKLGLSAQGVAQWENDLRNPKIDTLQRIASALGVSVNFLLGREVNEIIPGRLCIVEVDDPDAKNLQYRIEAADPEAFQIGLRIMEEAGIKIPDSTIYGRIFKALDKLNEKGLIVAVERLEELVEVPAYKKQE